MEVKNCTLCQEPSSIRQVFNLWDNSKITRQTKEFNYRENLFFTINAFFVSQFFLSNVVGYEILSANDCFNRENRHLHQY